jgi:CheY-like chemotaxis protein/signal transduction histidine kinase
MTERDARRVLCIEDNPVNWHLVQRLLRSAGYDMHWAEDGLQGFRMAQELRPDLVLLDINLPGLSGFEVASKFRQHPELKDIPLVALTAKTQRSDRETALVAGCDGFIPKPIDPVNFVKQVESYLRGHREQLDESREGPALRQFNVQIVEHLEAQLWESQQANRKLLEAQEALEGRNRSLSRLLALAQGILAMRDPKAMLLHILEQVRLEAGFQGLHAYRAHASGGYWEGVRWTGAAFEEAPTLGKAHGFLEQARTMPMGTVVQGAALRASRCWEEGLQLGLWKPGRQGGLLLLRDREDEREVWGFWAFERDQPEPFPPAELETISLHASIAQVAIENAELFENLDESSRALALSYERMEAAYQDLHRAKMDLSQRDRQVLLEDLFFKITQRLEVPVQTLHRQSRFLEEQLRQRGAGQECTAVAGAIGGIREAVGQVDGLLKALLRRVGREGHTPEWINLSDLLQQEVELMQTEGAVPPEVSVDLDIQSRRPQVFGIYSDFAGVLLNLTQHALGGPTPSPVLRIRSRAERERYCIEVSDEGGPIPPTELEGAFEPFSELHQQPVIGVRTPGQGLALCKQILASYQGSIEIRNEGEGTQVSLSFPLK